jgi:hypothetical protein
MSRTIAVDVKRANARAEASSLENHVGNQQATRKNPHAIDAGSKPGWPVSYWCIMLMVISTMLPCEIYEQYAVTVWKK